MDALSEFLKFLSNVAAMCTLLVFCLIAQILTAMPWLAIPIVLFTIYLCPVRTLLFLWFYCSEEKTLELFEKGGWDAFAEVAPSWTISYFVLWLAIAVISGIFVPWRKIRADERYNEKHNLN